MSLQDFTTIRLPEGIKSIPARMFIGTVILFAAIWVVIGLISLRFDLTANPLDVVYTQLIILGSLIIAFANSYVMQSGGFNRDGSGQSWRVVSYFPVASAATAIMGMLMLVWPVWTSFSGVEPNWLLQVMFSLITTGLCATFAGFVSLADVARVYRYIPWVLYVLVALLAVEIMEGLWRFGRLQADVTGIQFRNIGFTIATATGVYAFIALAMAPVGTEKSRIIALIWYFLAAIAGFTFAFLILSQTDITLGAITEERIHRTILGVATILSIGTIGLALLHYYNHRPPGLSSQPKSPADTVQSEEQEDTVPNPGDPYDPYSPDNPYTPHHGMTADHVQGGEQEDTDPRAYRTLITGTAQGGDQEPPAPTAVARCPGCQALVEPAANFCISCGLSLRIMSSNCVSCGSEVEEGARFCTRCGTPI